MEVKILNLSVNNKLTALADEPLSKADPIIIPQSMLILSENDGNCYWICGPCQARDQCGLNFSDFQDLEEEQKKKVGQPQ